MRVMTLIATLVFVVGCQSETPQPAEVAASETASASDTGEQPAEPRPITEPVELVVTETGQPSLLESAVLRTGDAEPNGGDAETVRAGEPLEVVVRVKEVPEGLAAWVHWLGPDGETISEEQKSVPETRVVSFSTATGEWAAGEYSAEIFVGGDLVEIKKFRLTTE